METDPSNPKENRSPGTRGRWPLFAGLAGMTLVGIFALSWWPDVEPIKPSKGFKSALTPAPISSTPPADAPAPAKVVRATPAQQILLASNSFTTMEDYRRRRASMPQAPAPLVAPPAGRTPATELGRVMFGVRDFRAALGENPVGNNREITRALMGGNARGAKFLDPATATLDAKGELLDAWGRPYFFHAMSSRAMEIRSAGPDGKLFTADDLVQ